MAKNVLMKKRNPAAINGYDEIHPITKAGNVFTSAGESIEDVSSLRDGYGVTTNSANNYSVNVFPAPKALVGGLRVMVKINADSTGAAFLNINGLGAKAIKKANGTNVTNLRKDAVYTLVYNGVDFTLQGEGGGGGTAVAGDIRAGKTAETDTGPVTGSIPVRAGGVVTPGASPIIKGAGIYDDSITVAAVSVPANKVLNDTTIAGTRGAVPIITSGEDPAQGVGKWPDGALAVYPREGYRKGGAGAGEIKVTLAQMKSAEPNLNSSNIRSGVSIFGEQGTLQPKKYASGSWGSWQYLPEVAGLSFRPTLIFCWRTDQGIDYLTYYIGTISTNSFFANTRIVVPMGAEGSYVSDTGFKLVAGNGVNRWEAWG